MTDPTTPARRPRNQSSSVPATEELAQQPPGAAVAEARAPRARVGLAPRPPPPHQPADRLRLDVEVHPEGAPLQIPAPEQRPEAVLAVRVADHQRGVDDVRAPALRPVPRPLLVLRGRHVGAERPLVPQIAPEGAGVVRVAEV